MFVINSLSFFIYHLIKVIFLFSLIHQYFIININYLQFCCFDDIFLSLLFQIYESCGTERPIRDFAFHVLCEYFCIFQNTKITKITFVQYFPLLFLSLWKARPKLNAFKSGTYRSFRNLNCILVG